MTNKRILHVEDEENTLELMRDALNGLGELVQVGSIEEAHKRIQNETFNLIILDFTLPDGSGQVLLQEIKALIDPPAVIVLSGHELVKDMPGVDKVLTKGRYQVHDLIGYVKEILNKA